jgi:hypothetical protein
MIFADPEEGDLELLGSAGGPSYRPPRIRITIDSGGMPAKQMLIEVTERWKRWRGRCRVPPV